MDQENEFKFLNTQVTVEYEVISHRLKEEVKNEEDLKKPDKLQSLVLANDSSAVNERQNNGRKVAECAICGNVYTRREHLITHLRSHSGDRPFSCTECDYKSSRKAHLVSPPNYSQRHSIKSSFNRRRTFAPIRANVLTSARNALTRQPKSTDWSVTCRCTSARSLTAATGALTARCRRRIWRRTFRATTPESSRSGAPCATTGSRASST